VPPPSPIDQDLSRFESELKRLEVEYTMFFSGRSPKPPVETRSRVEALIRQYDRAHIANYGSRFRFSTLQSRFAKLIERWDRGLRAREEGRAAAGVTTRHETAAPAEARAERRARGEATLPGSAAREGSTARALRNAGRGAAAER
jgi:hypothetical protein